MAAQYLAAIGCCGFPPQTIGPFTTALGAATVEQFQGLTRETLSEDINNIRRAGANAVQVTLAAEKGICGLKLYMDYQEERDEPVDMVSFTIAVKDYWVKMNAYVTKAIKMAHDDRDDAVLPVWESAKKWLAFERKYQAYLWALRGGLVGVTPLAYVVRPVAAVTMDQVGAEYDSIEQDLYETSSQDGDHFTVDNGRVFVILKRIYADTPLYHLIKPFERTGDGRGAFLVLKNHFEGTAMIEERKHSAHNIIEQAFYTGKNDKSYSLDDYINKHLEAHQELAELEQPVDEGYKISQFLKNIHDESLKLTVNMIRVHGGPLMTDFHLMVSKIQECHRTAKNVANAHRATAARTIAVVGVQNPRKRKGGKGGKGGNGTGGKGTTPTKAKGGGKDGGGAQKAKKPRCAPVDNPNVAITGGFYTHDVFVTLSENQQKEVIRLRAAAGGNAVAPARAAAPGRAIKSVGIQEPVVEIAAVAIKATATDDGIITVDDGDKKPAAVQFGRHAYHRTTIEAGHRIIKMVKRGAAVLTDDDPEVVWDEVPGESLVNLAYRTAAPTIDEPVNRVVTTKNLPLLPPDDSVEAKDAEEDTEEEMKPAVVEPGTVVDQGPPMSQKSAESEDEEAQKAARNQEWISINATGFAMGHREPATDEDSDEDSTSEEMQHAHKVMRLLKQYGTDAEGRRAAYTFTDYDMLIHDHVTAHGTICNKHMWAFQKMVDGKGKLKPVEPMLEPKEGGK
jgi:hypothetical protein